MKSSLRICVVISTVLVLGTTHPQNYHQHPGYSRDQQWNQHQPQNHPVHQWPNHQQTAGLEAVNYQNFQKPPIQANSQSPAVVVNVNEVPQEVVHANHTHRVRKISVPLSELDKYKGARIIHLKDTGNKDFKILRVVGPNDTVYEEKDIPDSLKDIIAKALARESETIHSDPVNAQSVNVQNLNDVSRPVGSPRPRNRFGSGSNERPVSGYPFRRRRPFQKNYNVPVQSIRGPALLLDNDNVKVATVDHIETAEVLSSLNDDDDSSFVSKHGRTLLTTTDDIDSEIVPLAVTEPLTPTNSNDDDDLLTATELRHQRALLNNDVVFSNGSSTTATELTNEPIIDMIENNNVFIDNETGKSDTANDNSNTISSINKTDPTASTFAKPSEASIKPLATIVVSNQALDSSNSLEVRSPYVFISPYLKDGNATKESSTFFTKLISHLIGKKPMNVAKIEEKNKTEFEEATDDEYLKNDDDESETFKKDSKVYRMTSKADSKVTSDDASTDGKDTLTPISFITSLTRKALKGGNSLKDFFNEQRVKDFLLRLI